MEWVWLGVFLFALFGVPSVLEEFLFRWRRGAVDRRMKRLEDRCKALEEQVAELTPRTVDVIDIHEAKRSRDATSGRMTALSNSVLN